MSRKSTIWRERWSTKRMISDHIWASLSESQSKSSHVTISHLFFSSKRKTLNEMINLELERLICNIFSKVEVCETPCDYEFCNISLGTLFLRFWTLKYHVSTRKCKYSSQNNRTLLRTLMYSYLANSGLWGCSCSIAKLYKVARITTGKATRYVPSFHCLVPAKLRSLRMKNLKLSNW